MVAGELIQAVRPIVKPRINRGRGFRGVLNYVLDQGLKATGDKQPELVSSNMSNALQMSAAELAAEFGAIRGQRPDIERPVSHWTLSLAPGEHITAEKWDAVVQDFMRGMGMDPKNHQYIAVRHADTEHDHIHIIANRIGIDNKVWLGKFEADLAAKSARGLEVKHGLQITSGWGDDEIKQRNVRGREMDQARRTQKTPERMELQAIVRSARDNSKSFPEFVSTLEMHGVRIVPSGKTGQVSGASFEYGDQVFSGSKLGDDCKWKPLAAAVSYDADRDAGLVAQLRAAGDLSREARQETIDAPALQNAVIADCLSKNSTFTLDRLDEVVDELTREMHPEELEKHEQRIAKTIKDYQSSIGQAQQSADGPLRNLSARGLATLEEQRLGHLSESVLRQAPGDHRRTDYGLRPGLLPADVAAVEAGVRADLIDVGRDAHGNALYTGSAMLGREVGMLQGAGRLARDRQHDFTDAEIASAKAAWSKKTGFTPTDEQSGSADHALHGRFAITQGSAGSGKTTVAEIVKIAHEARGDRVIGACVAKRAAQNLHDETGIESFTVAKLVGDLDRGTRTLSSRDVILVDEAGQLGTGPLASLIAHIDAAGAKLVLTGEDKQLDAIQHGGPLRLLSRPEIIGTARIEKIIRQDEQWARDAVMNFRDGKASEAFRSYEDRNLVSMVTGGRAAVQDQLIEAWHAFEQAHPDKASLVLAHRNEDVRALSSRIREIRKAEGKVTGPDHTLACAHGDNTFDLTLAAGDRIRFTKNDEKGVGVINGTIGTIKSITPVGVNYDMTVVTDDGKTVVYNTGSYCNEQGRVCLSSAYAMTIYSSQGVTVRGDVFLEQSASMDRAATYVGASRAKGDTHFYVDRDELQTVARSNDPVIMREALVKTMSRDRFKSLAIEHALERDPDLIKELMHNGNDQSVTRESAAAAVIARIRSGPSDAAGAAHDAGRRQDAVIGARGPVSGEDRAIGRSPDDTVGRRRDPAQEGGVGREPGAEWVDRVGGQNEQGAAGHRSPLLKGIVLSDRLGQARSRPVHEGAARDAQAAPRGAGQGGAIDARQLDKQRRGSEKLQRRGGIEGQGNALPGSVENAGDRVRHSGAHDRVIGLAAAAGGRNELADAAHGSNREAPRGTEMITKALDAKVQAWRKESSALDAPAYRVICRDRDPGRLKTRDDALVAEGKKPDGRGNTYRIGNVKGEAQEKFYTAKEVEALLPRLSRENARGFDIYVTPIDQKNHYMLVDDLKGDALTRLKSDGYQPCLVMTSSAGNQQAILKMPKAERADEQSLAVKHAQAVNDKYGDADVVNIVQPFRMAGFANKKASRASEFTKIDEVKPGHICQHANDGLQAVRQKADDLATARAQEKAALEQRAAVEAKVLSISQTPDQKTDDPVTAYRREANKVQGLAKSQGWKEDWSRIDYQAGIAMARCGWDAGEIKQGIRAGSPEIDLRHHNPDDYTSRTVQKIEQEPLVQQARAEQAVEQKADLRRQQDEKRQSEQGRGMSM
jgi:hypothetical protein